MKKIISLIAILMSLVMLVTNAPVLANDVTDKRDENFSYFREGNMKGPWTIINYHGKSKDIKIPSKYRKNKIEGVYLDYLSYDSSSVTENRNKIESIYLPATIEWVAISGLKNLKKVTISKKNEFLKVEGKFILSKDGKELDSVLYSTKYPKIPKTVRNIGGNSFSFSNVRKVTFSKNIKKLGIYIFNGCKRLKEVTIESKTLPKLERGTFDYMKKGVKFYVKNKTVAKDLKENLDGKGTNADIYVKNKLVFENVK